jgi:hypothetical protein
VCLMHVFYARPTLVHDGWNQMLYYFKSKIIQHVCSGSGLGLYACCVRACYPRSALAHGGWDQVVYHLCHTVVTLLLQGCVMLAPRLFMTTGTKSCTAVDREQCTACARELASDSASLRSAPLPTLTDCGGGSEACSCPCPLLGEGWRS